MGKPVFIVAMTPPDGDAPVEVEVRASNRREAEVLARGQFPDHRRIGKVRRIASPAGQPRASPSGRREAAR
ncbi:hypothetical protein H9L17_15030 [Thermomonas brevis]|uniref:Uncharacterized protein n=1 Tax=Thermomonas brevis TaxID=215691 RepID=A0A7G9QSY1_9GAMM|nr:hypothetical protein [Thermomonas brevis]QNN46456.1 hypothetical protein H9L17_15030 [Thermomonas brevis]